MKRVRTAKGRKIGSTRWLERQLNDPYVKRARAEGYRSRAAYKLIELDERFGFLKGVRKVIDLGIAPGRGAQGVRRPGPRDDVILVRVVAAVRLLASAIAALVDDRRGSAVTTRSPNPFRVAQRIRPRRFRARTARG